jgi:hypothetical protein
MAKKENPTAGQAGVQVFELTMDNGEDQDDLNRRFHKPGEPNNSPSAMLGRKGKDESRTGSAEKNSQSKGES